MTSTSSDTLSLPAIILEGSTFLPHNTLKLELSESTTSHLLETWTNPDNALMAKLTGKWLVFFTALPAEAKVNLESSILTLPTNKTVSICATGCIGEIVFISPMGSSDQKLLVLVKGLSRCTYVKQAPSTNSNTKNAANTLNEDKQSPSPTLPYVTVKPYEVSMDSTPELESVVQKLTTHAIALFMLFPVLRSLDAVKALQNMSDRATASALADILTQSVEDQRPVSLVDRLGVLAARTLYDQLTRTLGVLGKVLPLVSTVAQLVGNNRNK
ncbi:hypothetical protein EON65_58735, partial [archaeon]